MLNIYRFFAALILTAAMLCASAAQYGPRGGNPLDRFVSQFYVEAHGSAFVGPVDFGHLGAFKVGLPAFRPLGLMNGILFGGNAMFQSGVTMGSRHEKGKVRNIVDMVLFEGGLKLPVVSISSALRLPNPLWISIHPTLGYGFVRSYLSGKLNDVYTGSVGVSMDVALSEAVVLSMESRWSRTERRPFLWEEHYQTIGVGVSVALGSPSRLATDYRQEAEDRILRVGRSVDRIQDSLNALRKDLVFQEKRLHDLNVASVAASISGLTEELRTFRKELENRQQNTTAVRRPVEYADFSVPPGDMRPSTGFDQSVLPKTSIIRVERKIFEGEDLVEEDYLKGILAILSNYDQYVWEIAYRDAVNKESAWGRDLASKIRAFFSIYNSRLKRNLSLAHDGSIRSEFEIRCLGYAR